MVCVRDVCSLSMMIFMPLTRMEPNSMSTAPPNTGLGMTENTAESFGHRPMSRMKPPATETA